MPRTRWILDTDTHWEVFPAEQPWLGRAQGLVPLKQSFLVINAVPLPFRLVYTHPPREMPFWNVVVFALLICPEAVCTDTQGLLSAASLRLRFENLNAIAPNPVTFSGLTWHHQWEIVHLPLYDTVKTLLHARYTWNYFHHTCIRSIWNTKEFLVLSLSPIPKQFIMYVSKIWNLKNDTKYFRWQIFAMSLCLIMRSRLLLSGVCPYVFAQPQDTNYMMQDVYSWGKWATTVGLFIVLVQPEVIKLKHWI